MKPFFRILLLLLTGALLFTACNKEDPAPNSDDTGTPPKEDATVSLDGKKILFFGDSFIYYGQAVMTKSQSYLTEESRLNDQGYFYQLCKANGENVSVTNWTFGGHGLASLCGESCNTEKSCAGVNHFSYLIDRNYDYVVVSGERTSDRTAEYLFENIEIIVNTFRAANPNVKFVYLVSSGAHNVSVAESFPVNFLNNLKTLEDDWGLTIVDWGKLVADVINGDVAVPGATQTYTKNSFVVNQSAKDGYHPNQLSGYITALMTYCAITGGSAVGQPYDFCGNESINSKFSFSTYISKYYKNGETTNYEAIFASKEDMKGIQQLIDTYLSEKSYRNYNY